MMGEPRYFLTAYGLARKHGFEGTEEEWLESLIGPVPMFQIGDVVTLPAGRPAYVELNQEDPKYPVLVFGIPKGEGVEDALMRTGGKMIGALDMNNYRLMNIPEPAADGDAVSKAYVELIREIASAAKAEARTADEHAGSAETIAKAALPKAGGNMTGALVVLSPTEDGHAVNLGYLVSALDDRYWSDRVVLTADGWTGTGPYTQTIAAAGMRYTDKPHYGVIYSGDAETMIAQKEAFMLVDDLDSWEGSVTFTCFEDKPGIDLTIQLEVNR